MPVCLCVAACVETRERRDGTRVNETRVRRLCVCVCRQRERERERLRLDAQARNASGKRYALADPGGLKAAARRPRRA